MQTDVQQVPKRGGSLLPSAPWQPLLDGAEREQALEAVQAIARALPRRIDDPSLAGGAAGLAVFHAYRADGRGEAVRHLDEALAAVSGAGAPASLYSGLGGVGWAAAHLQEGPLGIDREDLLDEIDEAL